MDLESDESKKANLLDSRHQTVTSDYIEIGDIIDGKKEGLFEKFYRDHMYGGYIELKNDNRTFKYGDVANRCCEKSYSQNGELHGLFLLWDKNGRLIKR